MFKKKKETKKTKKEELVYLLEVRTPGIFDREPAPAFNGSKFDALVKDILNLLK